MYVLIHLGNIDNSKGNIREERRNVWEISERETEHKLLTLGKELGVIEGEVGGGWGEWVMSTCYSV